MLVLTFGGAQYIHYSMIKTRSRGAAAFHAQGPINLKRPTNLLQIKHDA